MTFIDKVTGKDIDRQFELYNTEVSKLPKDYQMAWEQISMNLAHYADFTGRNLLPLLDNVLEMLIEMAAEGRSIEQVFGSDIEGFCSQLTSELSTFDVRDKWRRKLNARIEKRFGK